MFIEVDGRFQHDGDALLLLARLGAVSTHTGIILLGRGDMAEWGRLLLDAAALAGPRPGGAPRLTSSPDEMRPGAKLNMLYDDDEGAGSRGV